MSITDRVNTDPSRDKPNNDTVDPTLAMLLTEIDEPRCEKSMTDRDDPMREYDRSDTAEPKWE
jgi:hypothetical protein